jgi:hypothetical protein
MTQFLHVKEIELVLRVTNPLCRARLSFVIFRDNLINSLVSVREGTYSIGINWTREWRVAYSHLSCLLGWIGEYLGDRTIHKYINVRAARGDLRCSVVVNWDWISSRWPISTWLFIFTAAQYSFWCRTGRPVHSVSYFIPGHFHLHSHPPVQKLRTAVRSAVIRLR